MLNNDFLYWNSRTFRHKHVPTNIYLFKVTNRNTWKRYEIYSKLTTKTPEPRHWRWTTSLALFWIFYCYFWTYFTPFSSVSIVDCEQINVSWEETILIRCSCNMGYTTIMQYKPSTIGICLIKCKFTETVHWQLLKGCSITAKTKIKLVVIFAFSLLKPELYWLIDFHYYLSGKFL